MVSDLQPRRHAPPEGWDRTTFEALTDALAQVLVSAIQRASDERASAAPPPPEGHT